MTDTPIRTHATTITQSSDIYVPQSWPVGTPVLVVAGLPEGAELRRLCDVPEGWEWLDRWGDWQDTQMTHREMCVGLVLCRPKPVPAPPATERVMWHEALREHRRVPIANGWHRPFGCRFDDDGELILTRRSDSGPGYLDICSADADGMVEVLVDPAPTGDVVCECWASNRTPPGEDVNDHHEGWCDAAPPGDDEPPDDANAREHRERTQAEFRRALDASPTEGNPDDE